MTASLRPSVLKNGHKVAGGVGGGGAIIASIIYLITQMSENQTTDTKQEMKIEYNRQAVMKIEKRNERIERFLNRMDRRLARIETKLDQ